jgi:hypothetical protein
MHRILGRRHHGRLPARYPARVALRRGQPGQARLHRQRIGPRRPGGTVAEYRIEIDAPTAALGETGKLTATFAADGIKPVTRTTDVTVAEGVDLVAGGSTRTTAKPGADFTASLQVHNTTERVVHGAALAFGTDYGFSAPAAARFANCYYVQDQLNSCTFDQELQPGATYEAVVPYRLRPDTYAPSSVVGDFEWLTSGDYADLRKFIDDNGFDGPGRPGAGPKLELRALPAKSALAEPKQTDTDADNNSQDLTVDVAGKQGANLAAIGASLTGDAGDTVTATIGVANAGPATIDRCRNGGEAAVVVVSIPAGTKVVGLPDGCYPTQDGYLGNPNGKGLAEYGCFTDPVFPARTTVTWPFRLQLTEQVVNGTGWVEVNPPCACDRFHDANTKDNVATIVVNPRTAAGHGGAGGTGDTGGQGGGDGGGLPITGPRAGVFGGLGLLLVAAGIGGVVLARRRRTRFEV